MAVRNLLFDLGGVIMDIDRDRCVSAFLSLGMKDADEMLGLYAQSDVFADLESGKISVGKFHDELRKHISGQATDQQIDEAFTQFLVGIPVERLTMLRELRKRFRIYVLSNTNPIMWYGPIAESFRVEGLEREDYFDGIVTSFEAGCMKPAPEIFRYAQEHLGILPEETIFFDDSVKNCEVAESLGFGARHVKQGDFCKELSKI